MDKSMNQEMKKINEDCKSNTQEQRVVLTGEAISSGLAFGRAFLYTDILTRDLHFYSIKRKNVGREMDRIHIAIDQVYDDLDGQKKEVGQDAAICQHAGIFEAHQEMLKDEQLSLELAEEMESELINAEIVVRNVFRKLANKLRESHDAVFSSKADDLDDISRRILRVLVGYEANILELLPADSIIVTKRLLPSDTVHLKRDSLKGIVVEEGSQHSHSALLARAFGVTAIAKVKDVVDQIHNGDDLLLDGETGIVIINPSGEDYDRYEQKRCQLVSSSKTANQQVRNKPAVTKCGQPVKLLANAYSDDDFKLAYQNGCDGVGLFRLEQFYMSCKSLPDENTIVDYLRSVFQSVPDKTITVRLLDIGGDKQLPYLNLKKEQNPFLGVRGVRFLLKNQDILKTQIKAVWRLSDAFSLRLLIPMVTLSDEIQIVKQIVGECKGELEAAGINNLVDFPIGAMIETPAAVFSASELAAHVDFFSIGTNDLFQYVMAAGRENMEVTEYYEKGEHIIGQIIANVACEARKQDIEVDICGEMAADVKHTESLLEAGIRSLSVSPNLIPVLKQKIASIKLSI